MAYRIDWADELNRMQVQFYLRVKLVTLSLDKKLKYYLMSFTMTISKIFMPIFVCFLTKKIYNISYSIFILSSGSCPRGGT